MMKSRLLAAGAVLLFSGSIAAAAPATVSIDLNMRAGPGTEYGVVATIPAGATVDVGGCTGSWCEVNFRGASGFASASYLSGGGGAPSAAVVVPGYDPAPDYAYSDDDYDQGYDYGPSIGFYAGPRLRHGWHGRWHGPRTGNWQGGTRTGSWQGRWQGRDRVGAAGGGNINRGTAGGGFNRGTASGSVTSLDGGRGPQMGGRPHMGAQPQTSAPVGLRGGAAAVSPGGGARMGGAAMGGGARSGGGAGYGGGPREGRR
jgi:hypothetical protein